MRFLSTTLALAGMLAAAVSAAPLEASLVQRSPIDCNHVRELSITEAPADAVQCGEFLTAEDDKLFPLSVTGRVENVEIHRHIKMISNLHCAICVVWK